MFQYILLGMQAAGMIMDWFGMRQQMEYGRMGTQIQQAGINANIAMTRAQSEQASADAMVNLRKTMGSQAAIMAARGTRSGVGSALGIMNDSIGAFNKDERIRKLNQTARENELKANLALSSLHQSTFESQLASQFRNRILDSLPISSLFSSKGPTPSSRPGGNYGMTDIG